MKYSLNPSSDNCYEGTTCLINKFDIRDENKLSEIEANITFAKTAMLDDAPIKGNFDFEHYKKIHEFLFCDLYDWAGQIRTVNISKKRTSFTDFKQIVFVARVHSEYGNFSALLRKQTVGKTGKRGFSRAVMT